MGRSVVLAAGLVMWLAGKSSAVVTVTDSGTVYHDDEDSLSSVAHWSTGWSGSASGWDYVGTVGSASAVYLSNGWVISAAHVDLGGGSYTFTLNGITYTIVTDSITYIDGTDLVMFQISEVLDLPTLTISTSTPKFGSTVVMIGYGGGTKAWGTDTVSGINQTVSVSSSYSNTDFYVRQNSSKAISGDSGGAAFIYNSSTGEWELAGILEATGSDSNGNSYTYIVQLSEYAEEIETIMQTSYIPEPGTLALLAAGGVLLAAVRLARRK
jgi:hypothetical protein